MEDEIMSLLNEEIQNQISDLSKLEAGSSEKSRAIDDLTKLYKLKIEETKNTLDDEEREARRRMEDRQFDDDLAVKEKQLKEQVKDRWIGIGKAAAELVLPLIFYGAWMRKGLKFEETGAFTSTTFRGLINRFRPTK